MTRSRAVVRRVYDPPDPDDGPRFLVDRLWPRGIRTQALELAGWPKDLAPSTELRTWYGHRPERFAEFARRYRAELRRGEAARALRELERTATERQVTLLTATRDVERSAAAVLAEILDRRRPGPAAS